MAHWTPNPNRRLTLGGGHGFVEELHTNIGGNGRHVIATKVDTDKVKDDLLPIAKAVSENRVEHSPDFYPVRIIPQHVLDRAFREGAFNDRAWWKRWANSEEGRLFGIERHGKVPNV